MLEVTEVAPEIMVNLFCRDWAERWGKKMKSLGRFFQVICYQQDILAGNSVCITAAKLSLVSLPWCHHEWILLGPGRSPTLWKSLYFFRVLKHLQGHWFPAVAKQVLEYCCLLQPH